MALEPTGTHKIDQKIDAMVPKDRSVHENGCVY